MSDFVRLTRRCLCLQNQKRQKMEYFVIFYTDKNTGLTWYLTRFTRFQGNTSAHWHTDRKIALLILTDQVNDIKEVLPKNFIYSIQNSVEFMRFERPAALNLPTLPKIKISPVK